MTKCCACGEEFEDDKIVYLGYIIGGDENINYCRACNFVGAESKEIISELVGTPEKCADWVIVYDKESDWYVNYRTNLPIDSINGCKTRKQLNKLLGA